VQYDIPSHCPELYCRYVALFLESFERAKRDDAELIVVEPWSGRKQEWPRDSGFVQCIYGARHHRSKRRALGFNEGARAASRRWLIFHDIDVILPPDFFDRVDAWSKRGYRAFLNWSRMFMFRKHETTKLLEHDDHLNLADQYSDAYCHFDEPDDMGTRESTRFKTPKAGWRGYMNGSTTIDADLFWSVGGYNNNIEIGRDDIELHARLRGAREDMLENREPGDLWRLCPELMPIYARPALYKKYNIEIHGWNRSRDWLRQSEENPVGVARALAAVQRASR